LFLSKLGFFKLVFVSFCCKTRKNDFVARLGKMGLETHQAPRENKNAFVARLGKMPVHCNGAIKSAL
jgi:hypothetical protein